MKTSDILWHDAITPIVEYCAVTHGAKTAILNQMNATAPPNGKIEPPSGNGGGSQPKESNDSK